MLISWATFAHDASPGLKSVNMEFEVIGSIDDVDVIARGVGVKIRTYLRKAYGRGRWRELKGIATVRLPNGAQHKVELHWYEAHGIGRRDLKIKQYLDDL